MRVESQPRIGIISMKEARQRDWTVPREEYLIIENKRYRVVGWDETTDRILMVPAK